MTKRAFALFAHTHDPDLWAQRHAAGQVPGRLFYNLECLQAHGWDVSSVRARGTTPARVVNKFFGGLEWASAVPGAESTDALLAWTENSGIPASLRTNRPPIATGVVWMTDRHATGPLRAVAARGLRRAQAVWALSSAQVAPLANDFGVSRNRLHYLPFGIDTDFWNPHVGIVEQDPELVVAVGNDRHRDFSTLLDAFRRVRAARPGARLELVTRADVPLATDGSEVRHRFLDHQELRRLYRRAAVVLIALRPNLHVSGMTVALEAASLGVPVVMTRTAGVDDYVLDAQTGFLADVGDAAGLARRCSDLLADSDLRSGVGVQAMAHVRTTHSHRTQALALAQILESM